MSLELHEIVGLWLKENQPLYEVTPEVLVFDITAHIRRRGKLYNANFCSSAHIYGDYITCFYPNVGYWTKGQYLSNVVSPRCEDVKAYQPDFFQRIQYLCWVAEDEYKRWEDYKKISYDE